MVDAFIIFGSLSLGACVGFVAFALCAIQKDPAASRIPLPDAGGSHGRFDLLPFIPGSSHRAPASPLAQQEPQASGRGLHLDRYCANDVAVTITDDRIWVDVDGKDSIRIYRIKRLHVDDRRASIVTFNAGETS